MAEVFEMLVCTAPNYPNQNMANIGRSAKQTGSIANIVRDLKSGNWVRFAVSSRFSAVKEAGVSHTYSRFNDGFTLSVAEIHLRDHGGYLVAGKPEDDEAFGEMVIPPRFAFYQPTTSTDLNEIKSMEVIKPPEEYR